MILFSEWLNLKEAHIYPKITLQMNSMGHLHMWQGEVNPVQTGKYNFKANGKESDVYMQNQDDVDSVLNHLTSEEKEELQKGYPVVTNSVHPDFLDIDDYHLS